MASKVTPLYAETRILLNLWALAETPAPKSKFVPGKSYTPALERLVKDGALTQQKRNQYFIYSLAQAGESKLAAGLQNESFRFGTNIGPKTTNALLNWWRTQGAEAAIAHTNRKSDFSDRQDICRSGASIDSYDDFSVAALSTYDRLNRDYNLGDLVPIYRIRREMGDGLSRQNFNEWLLDVQANDLIQLTGGELPNVTADQLEDSVAIPGGGTRFYVKRL